MIAEKVQTTPEIDELRKRAKERLTALNKSIVDVSKANSGLLESDETWECTGELDISAVLIHTSVRITDMRFDNGQVLEFDGTGWGIGLGAAGKSIGGGIFNVSPDELLRFDPCKIQIFFLTAGIGGTEISFWDENASRYLGVFAAGSLGVGGGSFGGEGKFQRA